MRRVSASRVDQHINVAEAVQNFCVRTFKVSSLSHITGNTKSSPAIRLYAFNHVRRGSGVQTEDGNTHPGLRQSVCHDTAQDTAAARDDGCAASHIEEYLHIKALLGHISSSRCCVPIGTYGLYPKSGMAIQRSLR